MSRNAPRFVRVLLVAAAVFGLTAACGGKKTRPPASSGMPTTPVPREEPVPPPTPEPTPPPRESEEDRLRRMEEEGGILSGSLEDINAQAPLADIHFDYDSAALTDEARNKLESHGNWLRRFPSVTILIEGHCDERGTVEYNLALGERRAMAAYSYLQSLGVPVDRLKTISYGKEFPLDPGHDEAAWARNRRAHFVITSK